MHNWTNFYSYNFFCNVDEFSFSFRSELSKDHLCKNRIIKILLGFSQQASWTERSFLDKYFLNLLKYVQKYVSRFGDKMSSLATLAGTSHALCTERNNDSKVKEKEGCKCYSSPTFQSSIILCYFIVRHRTTTARKGKKSADSRHFQIHDFFSHFPESQIDS